ncbi:hypothetical protein FHS39_001995 [Streptomyces olivoverticillatus]|uniref:Uncharacterized protein n=1 Tax=Streptomyces olivoverticillatus TaxID=66427 RepID=A0A7W7PK96_9ACTN|nr:hypothetical protein [Streptomyces olivoverticillatus]MBB4892984.1 hypothetical protein [Streptomyces olivoverticillatus]
MLDRHPELDAEGRRLLFLTTPEEERKRELRAKFLHSIEGSALWGTAFLAVMFLNVTLIGVALGGAIRWQAVAGFVICGAGHGSARYGRRRQRAAATWVALALAAGGMALTRLLI